MTRDLAALARTLDALRALHACPLCHGSGEVRDDYDDTVSCSSCDGSGIAAPRAEDDVVSQMSRAAQSIDRVVDADVTALRDRLDAAERSLAHAHRRLDVLVALSQQGRDRVEDELARRLDAVELALATAPSLDRLRALVAGVDADPSPEITPELVAAGERMLA